MRPRAALAYLLLSLVSVASNLTAPFFGIELLKAIPTALLAVEAARATRAGYARWITIGVALGSVGDFLLATLSKALFIPGLVAFLLGHLAYIVAFGRDRDATAVVRRAPVLLALLLYTVCAAAFVAARDPVVDGRSVAAPVIGYVAVITTMTALALVHRAGTALIAWGAVVFVVSDSHIPINFFVLPAPSLRLIVSGYVTYYLAQYLIVEGACRESTARTDR